MKKNYFLIGLLALGLGMSVASCGDDDPVTDGGNDYGQNDDNNNGGNSDSDDQTEVEKAQNLDYTAENAAAWGNYATHVSNLLVIDATNLNNQWKNSYAEAFKNHTAESGYRSGSDCVDQMIDGMVDIANEVGTSKIGEPYNLWKANKTNEALYAVESWYSFHSRDDYKNNILSIARAFAGQRVGNDFVNLTGAQLTAALSNGTLTQNSILAHCLNDANLAETGANVWNNIITAWKAIDAIPQPFRNNIGSSQTTVAMDACAVLSQSLDNLKTALHESFDNDAEAEAIAKQFVDVVVLPTYADLQKANEELNDAVKALMSNPSNEAFENACDKWMAARAPWETSEAFLFGPVADLGLDPNMDSWPLDAVGISNLLKSQRWSDMEWSGSFDEESEAIGAAQSLRGFHTLEFLLFKNGQPRTVK